MEAIIQSISKLGEKGFQSIHGDFQRLRNMRMLDQNFDIAKIGPSENARATWNACVQNRMAWQLAGPKFRN